jgi:tetratricopeptide (TPR) repeat protein
MVTSARRVVVSFWLIAILGGCGGNADSSPEYQTATPKAESTRDFTSDSEPAPADSSVLSDSGDGPSSANPEQSIAPAPRQQHPIDQVPEGALYREALVALDAGQPAKAANIRDELKDHPTYGILADAIDAFFLVKQRKYPEALSAAENLSTVTVLRGESAVVAGEAFHGMGRWTNAIACFNNALAEDPSNVRAHQWLGAIYYDTGAMQNAIQHLHSVAALNPADHRALRLAGLIHLEYEKFDDAIKDYEEVLRRDPPKPLEAEVRRELADALRELRRLDEALEVLRVAPPTVGVLACRAECFETNGNVEEALECTATALELDFSDHRTNLVLGRIQLAQAKPEEAVAALARAVAKEPADHEARFLYGRALLLAGQTDKGQQEIEQSTAQKERFLEMAQLHLKAMESPRDVGVRLALAKLAEESGRDRTAITWYQAALGLETENTAALEALARLKPPASTPSQ